MKEKSIDIMSKRIIYIFVFRIFYLFFDQTLQMADFGNLVFRKAQKIAIAHLKFKSGEMQQQQYFYVKTAITTAPPPTHLHLYIRLIFAGNPEEWKEK